MRSLLQSKLWFYYILFIVLYLRLNHGGAHMESNAFTEFEFIRWQFNFLILHKFMLMYTLMCSHSSCLIRERYKGNAMNSKNCIKLWLKLISHFPQMISTRTYNRSRKVEILNSLYIFLLTISTFIIINIYLFVRKWFMYAYVMLEFHGNYL